MTTFWPGKIHFVLNWATIPYAQTKFGVFTNKIELSQINVSHHYA